MLLAQLLWLLSQTQKTKACKEVNDIFFRISRCCCKYLNTSDRIRKPKIRVFAAAGRASSARFTFLELFADKLGTGTTYLPADD
jgi:hypothetical protein